MIRLEAPGPELWRVAKIFSRVSGDRRRVGSGYLVSAGRVLTAAHVVQDREDLEVVIDNGGETHRLIVDPGSAWVAPEIDLGIVCIDPDWVEDHAPASRTVAAARFGRPSSRDRIRARLCGFAAFKLRDTASGVYRDSEELEVVIHRGSNMIEKTLQLVPEREWEPDVAEPGERRWSSMSGTAVWVDGSIVGIVSEYRGREGRGFLMAQPVERILSLPDARRDAALDLLGLAPADFVAAPAPDAPDDEPSSDLAVWPVPAGAAWGTFLGISGDRHAESLLTQLVLSRVPRMQIVVDPIDGDLAADLNRAERAYRQTRARWTTTAFRLTELRRRRWYTADLDADPETRGGGLRRMLLDGGAWTEDAEPAFVLRTKYGDSKAAQVDRSIGSILGRIAEEHPHSCVVVHLRAREVVTGVSRARRLARIETRPLPVYLRRRGEFRPSSERWASVRTLHDLIDVLDAAARRAGQTPAFAPDSSASSASSARGTIKPRALARQLVREIESTGIPATAPTPEGDLDDALLGALRDYLPKLYPAFLTEYASQRTGPGWATSMAFAAHSDSDFDRWIASAEATGAYPDGRHPWPARYGSRPYDRLARAIGRGSVREPRRWRHPSADAAIVADVALSSDWEDAETWRRLSARVPLIAGEAAMDLVCGADAAHPIVAHVLGYAPITSERLVQDRIDELQRLLVPHDIQGRNHDA